MLRRLIRRLVYPFVQKDYVYNDYTPERYIKSEQLPDVVFERDVMLVNCGLHSKFKSFMVTATPLNLDLYNEV